tara:strand:- start:433 stop:633 length:201 start_codon:yes stop_codon:yes gene_type:complete
MSDWEQQYSQICKTLDEIKNEVKENRNELQLLKQEMATGKGSIRAVMWIAGVVGVIWTLMKMMKIG